MAIRRRNLIWNFLRTVLLTPVLGFINGNKLLDEEGTDSRTQLSSGDICVPKNEDVFILPPKPKDGDFVQFSVHVDSLLSPAIIKYSDRKILGDKEDLVLDNLSNFNLVYKKKSRSWEFS